MCDSTLFGVHIQSGFLPVYIQPLAKTMLWVNRVTKEEQGSLQSQNTAIWTDLEIIGSGPT